MTAAAADAILLPICTRSALVQGRVRVFELGRDLGGRPLQGLLLLAGDRLRAYVDRCRHLPVPLDAAQRYLSADGNHLVCMTHGARFRVTDGMCEQGPCLGLPLFPLRVLERDGHVFVDLSVLPDILPQL